MPEQRINGVAVAVIFKAVRDLEREHGVCSPEMLVEKARRANGPLHQVFEWDNEKAAHHWRVEQARYVIRSIKVTVEDQAEPVPAFVHVQHVTPKGVVNGYMSTALALRGPHRAGVVNDALAQLTGLRRRYGQLTELAGVWKALDEAAQADDDDQREAA